MLLAGCAALLVLRPGQAAEPSAAEQSAPSTTAPAGIPLVLPVADAATVSVLSAGDRVDLYVAQGDTPPQLAVHDVRLMDIQQSSTGITSTSSHSSPAVYIVIEIPQDENGLVESLLAATSIVATLSAVASD